MVALEFRLTALDYNEQHSGVGIGAGVGTLVALGGGTKTKTGSEWMPHWLRTADFYFESNPKSKTFEGSNTEFHSMAANTMATHCRADSWTHENKLMSS